MFKDGWHSLWSSIYSNKIITIIYIYVALIGDDLYPEVQWMQ